MIKILIDTTVRKRDRSGNCYTFSRVTSTETNKSIVINDGWGSDGGNIQHMVRKVLKLDFDEGSLTESVLPIREYDRQEKYQKANGMMYTHQVTDDIIKDLLIAAIA